MSALIRYSLDANTLSHILDPRSKYEAVRQRFQAALVAQHEFLMCPMVYHEIKRGLFHKDAKKQMARLDRLAAMFQWQEFDEAIWENAARGWAEERKQGRTPGDADLLIAYHALHYSAILVTANVKDFKFLPVQWENWVPAAGASR